ncbi:MAG: ribokinase [Calditrichaeota bacterium]|nr:ribokinase [Calditrichota bacterium]
MPVKIIVVGSSNTDMIIQVPRIPGTGETVTGGKFSTAAGGKGANQAVAAACAGADVTFIARVGNDRFGEEAISGFKKHGINIEYIVRDENAPSGVAEIFVAEDGENSIAVAPGANANLSPEDIEKARNEIAGADILLLQLEMPIETVRKTIRLGKELGIKTILNPAPACVIDDDTLGQVAVLTPNESEAEFLTGISAKTEQNARKAAGMLLRKGIPLVMITLGADGVLVASHETMTHIPGFDVKAVDTTAAGDVFNGALAVAIAEGKPLNDSVRFAGAAAALSVTKLGAQPSIPARKEIESFLSA